MFATAWRDPGEVSLTGVGLGITAVGCVCSAGGGLLLNLMISQFFGVFFYGLSLNQKKLTGWIFKG